MWRDPGPGPANPHDVINIQYTSGTTGLPKGAMLTHRNLLLNALLHRQGLQFTERDRICIPVPLYHCFGCVLGHDGLVAHGAAMVVPRRAFEPLATLEAIDENAAPSLYGVPTMFIAELNHPEFRRFDFTSLRTGIMAGSPCPIEVMKRDRRRDGHCAR